MDAFPIPWNSRISFSEYFANAAKDEIPLLSIALLAGAESAAKIPASALFSSSQTGHVGQSLLLK